jgi:ParB family chromosome partitioning protein
MEIVDLPIDPIIPAGWNPNEMDQTMLEHLRRSIQRFGLVVPLVVRPLGNDRYETVGGAQRLSILKELNIPEAPCVIVAADDAEARLLGQALNHIAGSDNLGLRAQLLREVLEATPSEEVLALLPETAASLQTLTVMGQQSIALALQHWERTQKARLRHLSFQLTDDQLAVVEEVIQRLLPLAAEHHESPNRRGIALYLLCLGYLDRQRSEEDASPDLEERT